MTKNLEQYTNMMISHLQNGIIPKLHLLKDDIADDIKHIQKFTEEVEFLNQAEKVIF
jgi:hypothetical protein